MNRLRLPLLFCALALAVAIPACGGGRTGRKDEGVYGKYTLYQTKTDQTDQAKAENNASDVLTKLANEDNVCLIGLWAYNPPAILTAAKKVNKAGKVHIVGFDEDENTLRGIKDGHIAGTVVQQPFEFGYQSVRIMAHLVRHPKEPLPETIQVGEDKVQLKDGKYYIPHKVVTEENVEEFHERLQKQIKAGQGSATAVVEDKIKVAFVTNNPHEFWTIAEAGTRAAAAEFNVNVEFKRPEKGTVAEQQSIIQDLLNNKVQAIAISVNDPANQKDFLNKVASRVPLITQDNDAPDTDRACYIGTDNVTAGHAVGKLVKKAMPEGGTIAIFVGQLDALNAQQRKQGVLEELEKE
jgi:ribose transport system substrate-binding protein